MAELGGPHGPRRPTYFWGGLSPQLLNFKFCLKNISIRSITKVNCLMKKNIAEFWQCFVNVIFNRLFVIWQDFVIVWQNTPCPICHPAMACSVLTAYCCWTVLPDGVIQHSFYKNGVTYTLVCMGVGRILSRGEKFVFYHSKLRKQPFLLKFSNSCPPSDTHACV